MTWDETHTKNQQMKTGKPAKIKEAKSKKKSKKRKLGFT